LRRRLWARRMRSAASAMLPSPARPRRAAPTRRSLAQQPLAHACRGTSRVPESIRPRQTPTSRQRGARAAGPGRCGRIITPCTAGCSGPKRVALGGSASRAGGRTWPTERAASGQPFDC
jgi:hypothetical protein